MLNLLCYYYIKTWGFFCLNEMMKLNLVVILFTDTFRDVHTKVLANNSNFGMIDVIIVIPSHVGMIDVITVLSNTNTNSFTRRDD
jgi:hypothetical protein